MTYEEMVEAISETHHDFYRLSKDSPVWKELPKDVKEFGRPYAQRVLAAIGIRPPEPKDPPPDPNAPRHKYGISGAPW